MIDEWGDMKFGLRPIGSLLGALAIVATTAFAGSAPANAAVDCGVRHWQPISDAERYVADGQAARVGIYAHCAVVFRGPTLAQLHCWRENDYRTFWWFVSSPRGAGWVFEGNFGSPPNRTYRTQCVPA